VTLRGGFAATAITAVTVQNTLGVHGVFPLSLDLIEQQARAVLDDIGADAIKTGMLGSTEVVERVAAILDTSPAPAVVDPVMIAKGGAALLDVSAIEAVQSLMVPRAALLTPNAPEAEALTGLEVRDLDGQRRAGEALLNRGARAVLMKGGHVAGETVVDLLLTPDGEVRFEGPRLHTTSTHGTGCTLASACAAGIARGLPLETAVAEARAYVTEAIRQAPGLGGGHGPLDHAWPIRDRL
jgi:hydroxymethylpyrimidine/phosphomethylpyrimidine kinase